MFSEIPSKIRHHHSEILAHTEYRKNFHVKTEESFRLLKTKTKSARTQLSLKQDEKKQKNLKEFDKMRVRERGEVQCICVSLIKLCMYSHTHASTQRNTHERRLKKEGDDRPFSE